MFIIILFIGWIFGGYGFLTFLFLLMSYVLLKDRECKDCGDLDTSKDNQNGN